ncbi:class I SAM-dependent methyltransferase [Nocardia cyriacigeorgica]|uniref:Class I SAM-dependent methyltransferase n=1 Tax=Nocardia cyriacigeorgica TaxID=135487 RepID=A0ABX0CKB6_9NOCA|nr:class I SAM-dependent methyltransferase [Nocardia cyriacigeorgica]NEW56382.1 class I SAM-dependent methyltransferase [Nocardia cyriacigeorgica]
MIQHWVPARYARTAEYLFPASQQAVAGLGLRHGDVLLDSATGTGNAAVVALHHGARVIGVDSSPAQIAAARERLPTTDAEFVVADAEDLPFPTAYADAGVSVFGIIFAHDPAHALSELVRCVRPGGPVAFTTLSADGWPNEARRILANELNAPPPPFPSVWRDPEAVGEAAANAGLETIEVRSHSLRLRLDDERSLADQVAERMGGLAAMRTQLETLDRWHQASARLSEYLYACPHFDTNTSELVDPYLLVTGRKRRTE